MSIPIEVYQKLFNRVRKFFYDYFLNTDNRNIIAVDGTFNNTKVINNGKLETTLNIGYFMVNEHLPIDITFCGSDNKNAELFQVKKYINKGCLSKFNNVTIVADRLYFNYKFFNNLKNFKFVIRIKQNCLLLRDYIYDNKLDDAIKYYLII
jgi:hypothetical protein